MAGLLARQGGAVRLTTLPRSFSAWAVVIRASLRPHLGLAMPIGPLLEHDHAFTPEDVTVLSDAFEDTLRALKLVDRKDQLTVSVAKLIIEFAKQGERDPVRLRDLALKTVRPDPALP
jgi:hypothetical protein